MSKYICNPPLSTAEIISNISLVEVKFYIVIFPYEWAKPEAVLMCICLHRNLIICAFIKKENLISVTS